MYNTAGAIVVTRGTEVAAAAASSFRYHYPVEFCFHYYYYHCRYYYCYSQSYNSMCVYVYSSVVQLPAARVWCERDRKRTYVTSSWWVRWLEGRDESAEWRRRKIREEKITRIVTNTRKREKRRGERNTGHLVSPTIAAIITDATAAASESHEFPGTSSLPRRRRLHDDADDGDYDDRRRQQFPYK